jgi:outer membrane protein OmpA-like peptidoglycan-associated protein
MRRTLVIMLTIGLTTAGMARADEAGVKEEAAGFGLGALVGGLVAGPPGAVVGAAGGAWLGARELREQRELDRLSNELLRRNREHAELLAEIERIRGSQSVLDTAARSGPEPDQGTVMAVLFRTDSADIEAELAPGLDRLARVLLKHPTARIVLSGYADARGSTTHNQNLSRTRAEGVRHYLVEVGIASERIDTEAYGETRARAGVNDREAQVFDRRVTISIVTDGVSA